MFEKNPGLLLVISYLLLFTVNALVLWLAYLLFPDKIVLGTISISKTWSVIHSMGMLTLINAFAIPIIREYELTAERMLKNQEWMLVYFAINFTGIWLITRFADQIGMGITSWNVALILAVVLDVLQGIVMMQLEKFRTR